MTLTEVTTDFTSGAALGAASSPWSARLWAWLPPRKRGCPAFQPLWTASVCPALRPLPLADCRHHPAEPHGEKPSEAPKGLALLDYSQQY